MSKEKMGGERSLSEILTQIFPIWWRISTQKSKTFNKPDFKHKKHEKTVLRNIKIKLIKIHDKETILKADRKDTWHMEG